MHCRRHESGDAAFERVRAQLFAYDIFSPSLMRFSLCSRGRIELGGLIVQRAGVGPIRLEGRKRFEWSTSGTRTQAARVRQDFDT